VILHARQQVLAMLDTTTGEVVNMILKHEGDNVREFYSKLPRPVRVGIQATGSMQWFLNLMEARDRMPSRSSGTDSSLRTTKAETRSARCGVDSEAAGGRSLSGDLAAFEGAAGSTGLVAASSSVGTHGGRGYKMRCSRLPWRMAYDEAPPCGATTDKAGSQHCRWRPTPLIGGVSCRRCTRSSKRRSRN
jgi:hypothetical protein